MSREIGPEEARINAHFAAVHDDIAALEQGKQWELKESGGSETVQISERGIAVVESGLTVRQAHEIKTGCSQDDLCAKCRRAI